MTFSLKRVNAILLKDYKDFSRNYAISIMIFLPPVLAAMYSRMGADTIESYYLLINMTFAFVSTFVQTCLIAEENEKDTLRGLMLSPASIAEILSGKGMLTFILTIGVTFFTVFLTDYRPENIAIITVALVLSAFFYIGLGTLLGLFAKSVMEASLIVLPVLIVFTAGSFITLLADTYPILKVANYLPNIQLIELASRVETGAGFGDVLLNLGVILAWVIAVFFLTVIVYRKRMVD